jgi:hypothetical protein
MNKELSKMDIVLFALYKLGGILKKVHTEEITWEAYQLAKEKFSWCLPKFIKNGFPDKLTALIALEVAHKEKYGSLVIGRAGRDASGKLDGWQFTPQGTKWIRENKKRILVGLNINEKKETLGMQKSDAERFIKKIKTDSLFKHFQEEKTLREASQYMFTDMLVCAPDSSKDIIKQKFERLYYNAELANDTEILNFLKVCSEKYKDLIT